MLSFFSAVLLVAPVLCKGLPLTLGTVFASLLAPPPPPKSDVAAARGACVKKHWFVVKKKDWCKLPGGAWAALPVFEAQGELHCKEELTWSAKMGDMTGKAVLDATGKAAAVATL